MLTCSLHHPCSERTSNSLSTGHKPSRVRCTTHEEKYVPIPFPKVTSLNVFINLAVKQFPIPFPTVTSLNMFIAQPRNNKKKQFPSPRSQAFRCSFLSHRLQTNKLRTQRVLAQPWQWGSDLQLWQVVQMFVHHFQGNHLAMRPWKMRWMIILSKTILHRISYLGLVSESKFPNQAGADSTLSLTLTAYPS